MTTVAINQDIVFAALIKAIESISTLYPYVSVKRDTFTAGDDQRLMPQQRFALMRDNQAFRLDLSDPRLLEKFVDEMARKFDGVVADALFAPVSGITGATTSAYADGVRLVDATSGLTEDLFIGVFDNCHNPEATIIVLSDSEHRALLNEKQLVGGAPSIHVEAGKVTHVLGIKVAVRPKLVHGQGGEHSCFALTAGAVCAGVSIDVSGEAPVCVLGAVREDGELIQRIVTTP